MNLRTYQQRTLDCLYQWWCAHPGVTETPLLVLPTGAGKSHVIAELVRLLFDTWPDSHPRTVVLVPSKELAEQNAEKLAGYLPTHISLGYYSASLGRKIPNADVIVATIGSIYKDAHLLGNIKCVIIDEAHLVNPDGKEAGRFRQFLRDLAKTCAFRVVGLTATPFRGNGVWLTDGEDPLFTGIAATVTVGELLEANYLAPLIRPIDAITAHIDTTGVKTTGGDYNMGELSERIESALPGVAENAVQLAVDRKKLLAFTATVDNAQSLRNQLRLHGITCEVVTGDTPAGDRKRFIAEFRAGNIRCLVTVLALATGFDVPDVDCIIWCRPTISPVLYVQGAGRGLRIAPGKTDCLWLDFSDTTERLGPVDAIKGKKKRKSKAEDAIAPHRICDNCGERCAVRALECAACGFQFPEPEPENDPRTASNAAIMAHQVQPKIVDYPVSRVEYSIHQKEGKPDSLRVDYYAGLRRVGSEWVCFGHHGFARAKAEQWWAKRIVLNSNYDCSCPVDTENPNGGASASFAEHAIEFFKPLSLFNEPTAIRVNETGKYPEIIGYQWAEEKETA